MVLRDDNRRPRKHATCGFFKAVSACAAIFLASQDQIKDATAVKTLSDGKRQGNSKTG